MKKIILSKKKIQHAMVDGGLTWRDLAREMNCTESGNAKRLTHGWPIRTSGRKLLEVFTSRDLSDLSVSEIEQMLQEYV